MKATHIVNGVEIKHAKTNCPPGYQTPSKSAQLAKRRERISKRKESHADNSSASGDSSAPNETPRFRKGRRNRFLSAR